MSDASGLVLPGGAFELLFERADLPAFPLPDEIVELYGGVLGLRRPSLFANFVASVDGAVALEGAGESGHVISGNSDADHFVMGLLRACADAVVIGASTLRASPKHLWTADRIFPKAAARFADLRRSLGLGEEPRLVVVTASGVLDPSSPALRGAIIATTPGGKKRLAGALPPTASILVFETGEVDRSGHSGMSLTPVVEHLHAEKMELILTEGGPTLVGRLIAEDLLDELFLTVSPRLFGRYPGDARKALVEGVDLSGKALELSSVRRHGSHLFLRYGFR
jgi:riboflavin biosynthesis pyrimidine reductase